MSKISAALSMGLLTTTLLLTACATPKLVVTNQRTGVSGQGTASGATFNSLGEIKIQADGEDYQGTWVTMRDKGHATLSFWSPGPKDSGVGIATLQSNSGKHMRCEFSYSMTSYSGIGLCKSSNNQTYDLMMTLM